MGSRGHKTSSYEGRSMQEAGMMHHGSLPTHGSGGHHSLETLRPPTESLENKVAVQGAEMDRLVMENQKLAATHGALREEILIAQQERQRIRTHVGSVQTENNLKIRGILDKISKMEADIKSADAIKKELQQAHMTAQSLVAARQELSLQIQRATMELHRIRADINKLPNCMFTWMKRKRPSTIMMADGSSFKLEPPATVSDAIANHPDYVVMESEEVKRLGVNAVALHPDHPLKPNKLYFIVKLPKVQPPSQAGNRVNSGINMTAKERLENLMLSRRAVSDITFMRTTAVIEEDEGKEAEEGLRVKLRLPKSEVDRLVRESGGDKAAAATKIMELCISRETANGSVGQRSKIKGTKSGPLPGKTEKRMRFSPHEPEIFG